MADPSLIQLADGLFGPFASLLAAFLGGEIEGRESGFVHGVDSFSVSSDAITVRGC